MYAENRETGFLAKYASLLMAMLVLATVVYVRIRLLSVPLERDEGEFAYMGQLLLKGISPFSNAYTMKLPGVGMMYAFFMSMFGQTPAGIHAGLLIVNAACIFQVFLIGSRFFDRNAALFSCVSYAVLSLSNSVLGIFAHATQFIVLFALAGFLLLFRYLDNLKIAFLLSSGFCFGLAFTMKQHAAFLLLFAVVYYGWHCRSKLLSGDKKCLQGSALFITSMLIPYALIVIWMVMAGSFNDFWFWTIQYAREYTSNPSFTIGWLNLKQSVGEILSSQLPIWLLAGLGIIVIGMKKSYCADRFFVFGFLLSAFLAICPGLFFRKHYFVLLLPAVALLAGAGTAYAGIILSSVTSARIVRFAPAVLFMAAVAYGVHLEKDDFFIRTPLEVSRAQYGTNPFPEAQQIAAYIKNSTAMNERIAVLGSEPEIYFYADRISATGHIYMYGLMENQPYAERMQRQMIREIETSQPKYVVLVNVFESWLVKSSSSRSVLDWAEQYLRNRYDQAGVADIIDSKTTHYLWGDRAKEYTPLSGSFLIAYKRKSLK